MKEGTVTGSGASVRGHGIPLPVPPAKPVICGRPVYSGFNSQSVCVLIKGHKGRCW